MIHFRVTPIHSGETLEYKSPEPRGRSTRIFAVITFCCALISFVFAVPCYNSPWVGMFTVLPCGLFMGITVIFAMCTFLGKQSIGRVEKVFLSIALILLLLSAFGIFYFYAVVMTNPDKPF